jgi:hypothetical protein
VALGVAIEIEPFVIIIASSFELRKLEITKLQIATLAIPT